MQSPIRKTVYTDVQPCLSKTLQTIIQDDDIVVYAKLNHELSLVDKPALPASSQNHTCSNQPDDYQYSFNSGNLLTLNSLSVKLHSISPLWYQFGLAVGISQNILNSYTDLPPDKCLVNVLSYWLTNHHSKPTWQDVVQALNEMKHLNFAESDF